MPARPAQCSGAGSVLVVLEIANFCRGVNSQTMQAFYDLLDNGFCNGGSTPVFSVNAGDHMWGYVTFDGGTNKWFVMIQDITRSLYYSNEWSYNTNTNTGEFI